MLLYLDYSQVERYVRSVPEWQKMLILAIDEHEIFMGKQMMASAVFLNNSGLCC